MAHILLILILMLLVTEFVLVVLYTVKKMNKLLKPMLFIFVSIIVLFVILMFAIIN